MAALKTGWTTDYQAGFDAVETVWREIAMEVKSTGSETVYPFLGQMPRIREWIGERRIRSLAVHGFAIKNRKFENTVTIRREDIEDDVAGVYNPVFQMMGADAARHPEQLIFELVNLGFSNPCYDGKNFFDIEHPAVGPTGQEGVFSNYQVGDGPAWFLFDTSHPIKPLIYQNRIPFKMSKLSNDEDEYVFVLDQFLYGVRGRSNAGYGMWEMAFASRAPLNAANYEAARAAMSTLRGDEGKPLGIKPTVLVAPDILEGDARRVLSATTVNGGDSNIWAGTAKLITTPYLG
ncbi:MAG TPA: Mu-like prophage major head subunit gpT family protein [Allosphingosinicella sp.]|jgi:phage major head subunit gpT-like protein